jgi:hypothetical protein
LNYKFKSPYGGFTSNFANTLDKYSSIGNQNKVNSLLSGISADDPVATPISKFAKIDGSSSSNKKNSNTSPNANESQSPFA